jgi:flagellar motility protein MotE (MotC chaperone)
MTLAASIRRYTHQPAPIVWLAVVLLAATAALLPLAKVQAEEQLAGSQSEIERFCSNITDKARELRHQLQVRELETLQEDVNQRIALLEEKRQEYEDWVARREAFIAKAEQSLVEIYARMRPDAAAERMAAINPELAASILMKLDPRQAGVVLNEMESGAAARLTSIIAAAARRTDPS